MLVNFWTIFKYVKMICLLLGNFGKIWATFYSIFGYTGLLVNS